MSDDHDRAPGSSSGGKRRAPEPAEQPRRRRRSMEGSGGVSVSDLVERHNPNATGSRSNLMPVPEADEPDEIPRHHSQPPASGRRAAPEPPSRHAAPEDVHRNVISRGGRRSAPEVPAPEPPPPPEPPRRTEQPRAEQPRTEQPRPEPRRNRTATHAVPADILAQSTGQPVDRAPRPAVPDEEDRPRSVVELLGTSTGRRAKKETFAESASRGRADAKRALPGTPPPPQTRHDAEEASGRRALPEPTGRRARPDTEPEPVRYPQQYTEPEPTGRRALSDARRRALTEPTRSEPVRRRALDDDFAEPTRSEPVRPALADPTRSEPLRRGPAHPPGTPEFPLDGRRAPEPPYAENRPPSPVRRGPQDGPVRRQPTGQYPTPETTGSRPAPGRRPEPPFATGAHPVPPVEPPRTGQHPLPGRPGNQSGPMPVAGRGPNGQPPNGQFPNGRPVEPPRATGQYPVPGGQPGNTGQYPTPNGREPGNTGQYPNPQNSGQYPVQNGRGPGNGTGSFPVPNGREPSNTGQYPTPNGRAEQFPAPGGQPGNTGQYPTGRSLDGQQGSGQHPVPGRTGQHPIPGGPRPTTGQHPIPGNRDDGPQDPPAAEIQVDPLTGRPKIPNQQPPGQSSMPPKPDGKLTPPPDVSPQELVGLTTEMEPIGEAVQKRRRVDQTLARFSKVHDEMRAEEKARRNKRLKLNPWGADAAELEDKLDELAAAPAEPTVVVSAVNQDRDQDGDNEGDGAEESADEENKPKRGRWSLIAKVFSGSAALLVFAATGVGWGFKEWADNSIGQVRALDPGSSSIQNADGQRGDENFLMVGSDTRAGAEAEDGVGDAQHVTGARSDTVMVAHIPADRSRVVIVSFPRDLEINRPSCERFDSTAAKYTGQQVGGEKYAKMNTAYEVGGPLCVTKVIQQLTGLQITRFISIDFNGFKGMVDAVDGVNVCVEKPMFDTTLNKWVVQQAGTDVLLKGDQALDFVRARHVRGDPTSDYGRIKRQQRFLSSLLRKAMSGQVLLDPSKLSAFATEFAKSTFGDNINVDSLMQLGQSLQNLEAGRVTFITVPTVGLPNARDNEVLRKGDSDALFKAIIDKTPLPGEAPVPAGTGQQQAAPIRDQQPVDPKTLKIQVLNGGNTTGGVARRTADKLAGFGFTVVQVNPTATVPKTVVHYGKGHEAAAQTLASTIPGGAVLQEDPSMSAALVLIIGPEFNGQVVAPNAGGTPATSTPAPAPLPKNLSTINADDVHCA
ncbi:LCP family protein [Actinokineospora inagensis]|uniref:LCP family protein n=1 Tax=Actinokineospora inagensis TaxID=103730 RepID=UPI0004261055|nr:LCP family protein [Actinokineospora inagensis]